MEDIGCRDLKRGRRNNQATNELQPLVPVPASGPGMKVFH
jgi:hypothetical protein